MGEPVRARDIETSDHSTEPFPQPAGASGFGLTPDERARLDGEKKAAGGEKERLRERNRKSTHGAAFVLVLFGAILGAGLRRDVPGASIEEWGALGTLVPASMYCLFVSLMLLAGQGLVRAGLKPPKWLIAPWLRIRPSQFVPYIVAIFVVYALPALLVPRGDVYAVALSTRMPAWLGLVGIFYGAVLMYMVSTVYADPDRRFVMRLVELAPRATRGDSLSARRKTITRLERAVRDYDEAWRDKVRTGVKFADHATEEWMQRVRTAVRDAYAPLLPAPSRNPDISGAVLKVAVGVLNRDDFAGLKPSPAEKWAKPERALRGLAGILLLAFAAFCLVDVFASAELATFPAVKFSGLAGVARAGGNNTEAVFGIAAGIGVLGARLLRLDRFIPSRRTNEI